MVIQPGRIEGCTGMAGYRSGLRFADRAISRGDAAVPPPTSSSGDGLSFAGIVRAVERRRRNIVLAALALLATLPRLSLRWRRHTAQWCRYHGAVGFPGESGGGDRLASRRRPPPRLGWPAQREPRPYETTTPTGTSPSPPMWKRVSRKAKPTGVKPLPGQRSEPDRQSRRFSFG